MSPLKKSAFINATIFLLLFTACGGGDDNKPPNPFRPTNPINPPGSDMRITVLTTFPFGSTTDSMVDVTYEVTPSSGAAVSEVYYSTNEGAEEYIYLRGGEGINSKGTLGTARVMLMPGENNIVFTAKDNAGKTASYTVPNKPVYDFGNTPDYDEGFLENLADDQNTLFVTNRIMVFAAEDVTDAQVRNAVGTVTGQIIGQVNVIGMYWIQLSRSHSEAELRNICDQLMAIYPDIFDSAALDIVVTNALNATSYTDDPWWNDWTLLRWYNHQWGLSAINVPEAWGIYSEMFRDVKVGVVDDGFLTTHEDLRLSAGNVKNVSVALRARGDGHCQIGTVEFGFNHEL